ncbi:unnamed protein product, partial [Prunus brigantina]
MQCVTMVHFQVNLNGEATPPFAPERGLRQGDPLSPYLFVLCLEKLSHLITEAVVKKEWRAVGISRTGPKISHLCFADDLLLFAEASTRQARVMKRCLDKFCRASGQVVSFEKSQILCSPNVPNSLAAEISGICESPLTSNLGKYLGVPLIHSRLNKTTYRSVVDKVQQKLTAWKGKLLSLPGRTTLIQSVTASIPLYTMQTVRLPASTCKELDKINRNFLWGSSDDASKAHLVKWDSVCKSKKKGGLGLKQTDLMNQSMLAKVGWRLLQHKESLWSNAITQKYLQGNASNIFCNERAKHTHPSPTWRAIEHGADILKKGIKIRVGEGLHTSFWTDNWVGDGPLISRLGRVPQDKLHLKVYDYLSHGTWDLEKLKEDLPLEMVGLITCVPAGLSCNPDTPIWKHTTNGSFSVK